MSTCRRRGAEPVERHHRLLDRDRRVDGQRAAVAGRRQHALGAQLGDGRPEHDPRRGLGQRHAGRLGDERHGARGARVGLEDVEHVGGERVLDVEQPAHPDAAAIASVDSRMRSMSRGPSVIGGSAHAESPEWMPASSMCSMTPPR